MGSPEKALPSQIVPHGALIHINLPSGSVAVPSPLLVQTTSLSSSRRFSLQLCVRTSKVVRMEILGPGGYDRAPKFAWFVARASFQSARFSATAVGN